MWTWVVPIALIALLIYVVLCQWVENKSRWVKYDKIKCEEVFETILQGELTPNERGQVFPTGEYASTAKLGIVYVTRETDGLVMALFPMYVGEGVNMEGYLYCSRPLTSAEIGKDHWGRAIVNVYSHAWYGSSEPGIRDDVYVRRQVSPTVYYVDVYYKY
jgi:hypothetical protein